MTARSGSERRRRCRLIGIRVTAEERAVIVAAARHAGDPSVAAYIRRLALAEARAGAPDRATRRAVLLADTHRRMAGAGIGWPTA